MTLADATKLMIRRLNLDKNIEEYVDYPIRCWYCHASDEPSYYRLDKIHDEKLGLKKIV